MSGSSVLSSPSPKPTGVRPVAQVASSVNDGRRQALTGEEGSLVPLR